MKLRNEILSDITVHGKYARHIHELDRRETWDEIVTRNKEMHLKRYPNITKMIEEVYETYVRPKKVLPSMRSMQFAGQPIERNPARIYNCAFFPLSHPDSFSELMFLLLGGTGVGYSVQHRHVSQLPRVAGTRTDERRYVVGDSIEGWSDAIKVLAEAYFYGKDCPRFDYSDVREKGSELVVTGGKAPGPDPLRIAITKIESILHNAVGRQLAPIEVHDIACHIADAVLSGGIRRAAMISLFSSDDLDMLSAKSGEWYELNPQRGRANNSAVLKIGETSKEQFLHLWEMIKESGAGEPGIFWTHNWDWGTNPCGEIGLKPYQFCNLTTINAGSVEGQEDFNQRAKAASIIGTLQAGYTDFHYLRPIWKKTTEKDALIGVSITGIASGTLDDLNLLEAVGYVNRANENVATLIGINKSSRTTTGKPEGTSSLVLGTSSGIHSWHDPYYVRRIRLFKEEPLFKYLNSVIPELIEDEYFKPHVEAVLSIPQKAPTGAVYRDEGAVALFQRTMRFNREWIAPGYREGDNGNNMSVTIALKEHEWGVIGRLLWENQGFYHGMTVLPYDGGTYRQAPFETITEEEFNEMSQYLRHIDLTQVHEHEDSTSHTQEAACAGGVCEIN